MQFAPIIDLFRRDPNLRWFFAARAQSSLGTGAGAVGLLVLAYDRFGSPWAISLILLADFLPTMFLGPLFGAAADRWSRRTCAVVGDLVRAIAFVTLGLVGGFVPTLTLALLAGLGTGLFNPAVLAALPGMVGRERLPAATSLFAALADIGFTVGPALAALGFLIAGPETVMIANGVTFAVSAIVLARLPFGAIPSYDRRESPRSIVSDARAGITAVRAIPGIGVVIVASSAILLFAGLFNVGEFLLATEELGAGGAGFAILVTAFGAGVTVGSLGGTSARGVVAYKHRYLAGLVLGGAGFLAAGLAPVYAVAVPAFALAGAGNGFVVVHERLLLQTVVPDEILGRIFGLKEAASAWGWAIALVSAGALFGLADTRVLLVAGGAGAMAIGAAAAWSLRSTWRAEPRPVSVPALPELVDELAPERAAQQASFVA